MSVHLHTEQLPPKSWDQFEELCADIFAAEWNDSVLARNGRAGQRQDGVDIVGRDGAQYPIGLQCKKKARWPVKRLTPDEVDREVKEAIRFKPKLQSFIILTTASHDARLQEHTRLITEKHAKRGLFPVCVMGWEELCRRATLHPLVAEKHFGIGRRAPLLASWFASKGCLELTGTDLALSCRDVAHDLKALPAGRVVLRQRESDTLVAKLAIDEGKTLSIPRRKARIALRDELAANQDVEKRISNGLTLLLGDPTIATWIFVVNGRDGDAARAVTGFVKDQLDPQRAIIKNGTVRLRLTAPRHRDIWISTYINRSQVSSIMDLMRSRTVKFGPFGHTNTVNELPNEVRAEEAIPAVISAILRQLEDGRTIEELRTDGILEIGMWSAEIG